MQGANEVLENIFDDEPEEDKGKLYDALQHSERPVGIYFHYLQIQKFQTIKIFL